MLGGVSKHPLGLPGAKAVTPWVLFFFLPFYMIARYYFLFGSPSFYLFLQPVQKRARSYHTPQWELRSDFHPQQVLPNHQQWVSSDGDILTAQGVTAYNTHISPDKIPMLFQEKQSVICPISPFATLFFLSAIIRGRIFEIGRTK